MKGEASALPVVLMFSFLAAVLYFAHQKNMDNIGEEGLKTFTASRDKRTSNSRSIQWNKLCWLLWIGWS